MASTSESANTPPSRLRVAVVQFAPKIGCVEENIAKALKICAEIEPHSVDLLCLPEMIFAGYVFENAKSISPFLELPRTGHTSQFCAELAGRLYCYVAAGYAELLGDDERRDEDTTLPDGTVARQVVANSAVVYGPDGQWVGEYRKTNLFSIDKTWAKPGNGFATFHLPAPLNTVTLGICNDLNTSEAETWTLEEGPYEVADHCIATGSNLLIMLNAWLDSEEDADSDEDWRTLNYWAARLRPLWVGEDGDDVPSQGQRRGLAAATGKRVVAIMCNRGGDENGKTFAGSSAVFDLRRRYGRPVLLQVMGRRQEGVEIWTV
ncbi:carbon-nitrogen hydrolase [Dentipellis sp. KUC8613]|nr:carbon-nitrogen hydrolase [Dentipellis sp. KUC8613]